jgi:uncharacterized protein (TIGR04255 family)
LNAIEILQKSYANELKFSKSRLLYIDAVDYDASKISPAEFVSQNLLTSIHTGYQIPGEQRNINIGQSVLVGGDTMFHVNIQNGINNANGNPCVIWSTVAEKTGAIKKEELLPWLDIAHQLSSDFFKKMLNQEFYASFDR